MWGDQYTLRHLASPASVRTRSPEISSRLRAVSVTQCQHTSSASLTSHSVQLCSHIIAVLSWQLPAHCRLVEAGPPPPTSSGQVHAGMPPVRPACVCTCIMQSAARPCLHDFLRTLGQLHTTGLHSGYWADYHVTALYCCERLIVTSNLYFIHTMNAKFVI